MPTPIQIGRSFKEWWFVAQIALGVVLLVGAVLLLIARHSSAAIVVVAGSVAAGSACLSAVRIARSRFQVGLTPDGFLVRDRRGEREFHDDQVICAALSSKTNYTNGVLRSMTRTFDVWVEGEAAAEQFKMVNRLPVGASDPLLPLIERILDHLHERAGVGLAAGQPFEGEGWTLHTAELIVNGGRPVRGIRFEALSAADLFDDHLCVWQYGQDEPVLRIPIGAANTQVLLRLLKERIAAPPEREAHPLGNSLGRILFQRRLERGMVGVMYLTPIAVLIVLAVTVYAAVIRGDRHAWGVGLGVCTTVGMLWALSLTKSIAFTVHEQGVRRRWLFGVQQLRFADVDTFTYSAVRQYVKGVYSGTNYTLTFASLVEGQLKKLTYSKNLRNADAELDHLRDNISQLIAQRMADQFAQGRAVTWTDGLRFLPEGLEYRAAGFLGRKAPVEFPYSQIAGYDLQQGTYWLWIHGRKKPVVKENTAQPNFFPGCVFLAGLLAARQPFSRAIEEAASR